MDWKLIVVLLISPLLLIQPCFGGTELPLQNTFKLASGLQMKRVSKSSSQFYQKFVPLVYQFSVPRWKKADTTVILGSQNCNTTSYSKFFTTCPILFYLNNLHDRFSEYLIHNQPLIANLVESGAKPESTLIPIDCELIKPHFDDMFVDKVTLDEYLNRLKSCSPLGSQEFIQGISNYVYNISSLYLEMRKNFYYEYWLKIDLIDGRVDSAIWVNAIHSLNSLIFQNYMMEANRWKAAVADCEAGRIPSTVLPPTLLRDTLSDMMDSLGNQSLLPSITIDKIGNYYKSSTTDCTFTNDTYLVRTLVPVIPKDEQFLLVKVSTIPFYYEEDGSHYQCQIDSVALPNSNDRDDVYVLVDLKRNIAYESDCVPGKLCHIPTALHPRMISPCATAAFNWERYKQNNRLIIENLVNNCPIKCSPVPKFKKSQVLQVSSNEFLVFNGDSSNSKDLTINCSVISSLSPSNIDDEHSIRTQKVTTYGTQIFEINCNCILIYESVIYKPKPCSSLIQNLQSKQEIHVSELAPVHWYDITNDAKWASVDFRNAPQILFMQPNRDLIGNSLRGFAEIKENEERENTFPRTSESSSFLVTFILFVCVSLLVAVVVLGWRLRKLIIQLEEIGFNVRDQGIPSNGAAPRPHQVSYRNMNSLIENDSLSMDGR